MGGMWIRKRCRQGRGGKARFLPVYSRLRKLQIPSQTSLLSTFRWCRRNRRSQWPHRLHSLHTSQNRKMAGRRRTSRVTYNPSLIEDARRLETTTYNRCRPLWAPSMMPSVCRILEGRLAPTLRRNFIRPWSTQKRPVHLYRNLESSFHDLLFRRRSLNLSALAPWTVILCPRLQ